MNDTVHITLKALGLSDKEIVLYTTLISSGVCTIKQLADATGMNRTTAYRFLGELKKRGFIEWVVGSRGTLVKASPLERLGVYVTERKRELTSIEAALPEAVTTLTSLQHLKPFTTQVRYFEGELGMKQMIWRTLAAEHTTRSYASLTRREVIAADFEDEFEREWARKGITDRVITNDKREEYISKRLVSEYRRYTDIRVIPAKTYDIKNDIIIYNDVFAIMSLVKDHLVGVEIENAEIAKTQRSIFDIVWSVATAHSNQKRKTK